MATFREGKNNISKQPNEERKSLVKGFCIIIFWRSFGYIRRFIPWKNLNSLWQLHNVAESIFKVKKLWKDKSNFKVSFSINES